VPTQEEEILFPPLTFLKKTDEPVELVEMNQQKWTVVTVVPRLP
jgi:hypothetical protein